MWLCGGLPFARVCEYVMLMFMLCVGLFVIVMCSLLLHVCWMNVDLCVL